MNTITVPNVSSNDLFSKAFPRGEASEHLLSDFRGETFEVVTWLGEGTIKQIENHFMQLGGFSGNLMAFLAMCADGRVKDVRNFSTVPFGEDRCISFSGGTMRVDRGIVRGTFVAFRRVSK